MKSKVSILVILLSLLLMCFVAASVYAASVVPDGFVGIPWGANRDQIIKAMDERGYTTQGTIPDAQKFPSTLLYRGAFGGQNCQLEFYLLNNVFHTGRATYLGMFAVEPAKESIYKQMVSQISVKYGLPQSDKITDVKGNSGKTFRYGYAQWDFVDSESSEKYMISVDLLPTGFNMFSQYNNQSFGYVTVTYAAVSIGERLQKKEY
jgi:hypothetical protein